MDAMTREILDSVTSIYGRLRLLERQVGHLEEMAFTSAENVRFHMEAANALTGDAAFTQDTIDEAVARVEEAETDIDEGCCQPWWEPCCAEAEDERG